MMPKAGWASLSRPTALDTASDRLSDRILREVKVFSTIAEAHEAKC